MSELEDIKLKALLNEMKLESPQADFSVRVMNKIFEESSLLEKVKKEQILGRGFWIIITLFVVLFTVIFFVSTSGVPVESDLTKLLPGLNSSSVSTGYQTFFNKMGTIPISIVGILLASSTLLFIDRIITANSKIFSV
ncbi:MAG: hypothetical protein HQ522_17505 [Bacteroidetes bacterium]|nr:hypothetical protein [Bacteroidota bacterium]